MTARTNKKFTDMANAAQVPEDFVIQRHRWLSEKEDYGLKLTNRTGTIKVGNQDNVNTFSLFVTTVLLSSD